MRFSKILLFVWLLAAEARAVTQVCVDVDMKSWEKDEASTSDAAGEAGARVKSSLGARWKRSLIDNSLGQAPDASSAGAEQAVSDREQGGGATSGEPVADDRPPIPFAQEGAPAEKEPDPIKRARVLEIRSEPDPHEIDPARYLKRMLEYEITHERGYLSVDEGCSQRVTVELYALEEGWTVFARYSGHSREEKVDRVDLDEFVELSQRVIRALLRDQSISETMTRENVLEADSEIAFRTIRGTGHLLFGMGTAVRVGMLPTADSVSEPARQRLRLLTPLSIHLGYRGKLKSWGLDAFVRMHLGTASKGIRSNPLGGHVDYAGSGLAGLHFLRYQDAAGIGSLYFGGGASFELSYFEAISPPDEFGAQDRRQLFGGGLNLDALLGYEFMRTSSVHFFTQLEVHAPTYLVDTERGATKLRAYLPGGLAQIGVVF